MNYKQNISGPVIIECFGLPGAGKTTVINEVKSYYKNIGVTAADRNNVANWLTQLPKTQKLFFVFRNPIWALKGFFSWLFSRSAYYWNRPFLLHSFPDFINKPLYLRRYLLKYKPAVCLLEQWSIQHLWSAWVGHNQPTQGWINHQVHHLEKLNHSRYIFFQIAPQIAAERIHNRKKGQSRFDRMSKAVIEKQLVKEYELMNMILNAVKESKSDLLIVDASQPPEQSFSLIKKWLDPFSQKQ